MHNYVLPSLYIECLFRSVPIAMTHYGWKKTNILTLKLCQKMFDVLQFSHESQLSR